MGVVLRTFQSAAQLVGILRAMENIMHPDISFIMLEIHGVRKSPDQNASKGVEPDWIMIGKLADLRKGGIKAAEKFVPQAGILLLIPPIGVINIRQRLRNQNNAPRHDRNGCVAWLPPMRRRKQDRLGSVLSWRAVPQLLPDGPAMNVDPPRWNPTGLRPIAGVQPPAARAIPITQSCRQDSRIPAAAQDPNSIT